MPILEHWAFATVARAPEPLSGEEIVLVPHPATGLALLVMVPDHDGRDAVVTLHDPARDVLLVTGGTMSGMIAQLAGKEVRAGPHSNNRVTFVPAGMRFALQHQRDSSMLVALILPAGRLAAMAAGTGPMPAPFALAEDAQLAALIHEINRLIMRLCDRDTALIESMTARLSAALVRRDPSRGRPVPSRIALPPHKLRSVLAFVDANLDRPIGLADMARHAGLSPFHFARAFKHATGRSPYDHIRWRRIVRSTALVARSELKIAEISASTGFASAAHFSQTFQRAAGVTPSQFRSVVQPRLLSGAPFGPPQLN